MFNIIHLISTYQVSSAKLESQGAQRMKSLLPRPGIEPGFPDSRSLHYRGTYHSELCFTTFYIKKNSKDKYKISFFIGHNAFFQLLFLDSKHLRHFRPNCKAATILKLPGFKRPFSQGMSDSFER